MQGSAKEVWRPDSSSVMSDVRVYLDIIERIGIIRSIRAQIEVFFTMSNR